MQGRAGAVQQVPKDQPGATTDHALPLHFQCILVGGQRGHIVSREENCGVLVEGPAGKTVEKAAGEAIHEGFGHRADGSHLWPVHERRGFNFDGLPPCSGDQRLGAAVAEEADQRQAISHDALGPAFVGPSQFLPRVHFSSTRNLVHFGNYLRGGVNR